MLLKELKKTEKKFLFFFDNVEEDIRTGLSFFIKDIILANGGHKFIKVLITVRIPYENDAFEPPCLNM